MKGYIGIIFLLLLILNAFSQNGELIPTPLETNVLKQISLEAQKVSYFQITINEDVDENVNMYILAQTPFNDPYEQPYISISSNQNYSQHCYQEDDQFTGVCSIASSELQKNRKFILSAYCLVDCKFELQAYFADIIEIGFLSPMNFKSSKSFGNALNVKINLPQDIIFTQIYILIEIENFQEVMEGLQAYANWGSGNLTLPTAQSHMKKGSEAWGIGIAIFLSHEEIFASEDILLYILLSENMEVKIVSGYEKNNTYSLVLNTPKSDFITPTEEKIYILDVKEKRDIISEYNLNVIFMVYSGSPTVTVSFDENFSDEKVLPNYRIYSTFSYLITPALRKQKGYGGMIYIKVQTSFSSNFYLNTYINKKEFVDLIPGVTELIEIEENEVKNFIFQDINFDNEKEQEVINYKTTVQVIQGQFKFGLRICESLQNENEIYGCLILNKTDLEKEQVITTFHDITITNKSYYHTHQMFWSYDVKKCPQIFYYGVKARKCEFHMIATSQDEADSIVSLVVDKRTLNQQLKQGVTVRDTIYKNEYLYYSFTLKDTEGINEIDFFLTQIYGDVTILLSRTAKFPDIHSIKEQNIITGYSDNLILSKEQITKGIYYIAVYSYEVSQYTLNIAIQRSKNSSETESEEYNLTEIQLQKGVTQKFTMNKERKDMFFNFQTQKDQQAKVEVISLKGNVVFQVWKSTSNTVKQIQCQKEVCVFDTIANTPYLVYVRGDRDKVQIFTITVSVEQQCTLYPMNFPMYVTLSNSAQCYQFRTPQKGNIQISIGLTALEFLIRQIQISVVFPQKTLQIEKSQKILSPDMLQLLCDNQKRCIFYLKFNSSQNITVQAAVQTQNTQNVLFGGIVQKVSTDKISSKDSKKFYYYLYENEDLTIMLTSKTSSNYYIVAKIVESKQFMNAQKDIYPTISDQGEDIYSAKSYFSQPLTILKIDKIKQCTLCVVLISVYGSEEDMVYVFTIQVSQTERELKIGTNKIGYLGKNQIHEYEVQLEFNKSSLLTVKEFDGQECLKSHILFKDSFEMEFSKYYLFDGGQDKGTVILKSQSENCRYKISLISTQNPLSQILPSFYYDVELKDNKTTYFLYYHNKNESFRIIETIESGDALVAATPLSNLKVQDIIKQNLQQYAYYNKKDINDLQISNTDPNFCFQCYYFIAVRGNPSINESILIIDSKSPILLKDSKILKDKLKKDSSKSYTFFSMSSFNFTINLLYGQVQAIFSISGAQGEKQLMRESIKENKEFKIKKPDTIEENSYGFDRYIIQIKGIQQSGYYVKAHQKQINRILTEGVPQVFVVYKNEEVAMQFTSIKDQGYQTILVQNLDHYNNNKTQVRLVMTASVQKQDGSVQEEMIHSVSKSDGSYNIQIKAKKGTYSFVIKSNQFVVIDVIFARKSLTHLTVGKNALMKYPTNFQIYNPANSIIIELFDCKGQMAVESSKNYSSLVSDDDDYNQIIMEHSNYGGHYVISSDNLTGQYYIKTVNTHEKGDGDKNKQILYIITYSIYESHKMPYKLYTIYDTQIQYKSHEDRLQFLINPIHVSEDAIPFVSMQYLLYISVSDEQIHNVINCNLGTVHSEKKTFTQPSLQKISFSVDKSKIQEIIGEEQQSYEVGAQAIVKLKEQRKYYIKQLNFAYDKTHVSIDEQSAVIQTQGIIYVFVFIVLPILIASCLLLLACRFCLRHYKAYPTQLIEDDETGGGTEDQIKNSVQNVSEPQKYDIK